MQTALNIRHLGALPQLEMRPVAALKPYERNARTHSAEQVALIARSITEFGWTNPILVDRSSGRIIAGHGRLRAAQQLGLPEVPVLELADLTPAQVRAYVIADNKLAELAGWDEDILAAELKALSGDGFDLALTGFEGDELEKLLDLGAPEPAADEDAEEKVPALPATRRGDVWILGDHRLVCGDSTAARDVQLALAGAAPHLMVTDPPYGIEYDAAWRKRAGVSSAGAAEAGKFRGGRKQSTVWVIEHTKSDTGHSTQKPVECMRRPILNNSRRGQAIYEPFAGSGTTIIAAEATGRRCLALELSPAYCDVIVRRWQKFTRQTATLEATGQTYAETEHARRA